MEPLNPDLEREIDDFFDEAKEKFDSIFNQFCSDPMRVYEDQSDLFLKRRDELLKNFELHLFKSCSVLKDLEDGANLNLNDVLNEKINKLTNDENQANNDLNELSSQKDKLRTMLDEKSNLIKESIEKKREIERICNESVKEEFVRLCKFMNLKFQWNQTDQKFTIVFLSDSSDVNQVKHINSKKIMANDEQYIKQLRDHFKIKVKQIVG